MFIRYNPHAFEIDGEKKKINKRDRESYLAEKLQNLTFDEKQFSVHYMFYDTTENKPYIFDDPSYNDSFKEFVRLEI